MKLRLLMLGLSLGLVLPAFAQIDVTQLTADTKTFIFDDDKNTVKNYIYQELEMKTSCCGDARIYLEVKIAPSGYVLSAKTLTGKNDCYKQSAIDIVKNIKWDAAGFQGPKSVYFEIKPEIECGDRANAYEALPTFNNAELDVNGVPLNYAGTTGVSALEASGGAPTGMPNPKVDPALATNTAGGDEGDEGETSEEEEDAGTTTPPAKVATTTPPAGDKAANAGAAKSEPAKSEPIAANTPPAKTTTTTTPAKSELDKAREVAAIKEDRGAQADEIAKLKAELEKVKKQEEERKEQARLAAAQEERQRMEDERRQREEAKREEDRLRREAERNRQDDRYADNNNSRPNNSRNSGYDDPYANNNRSDNRYDSQGPTDPPRSQTEAQRKEDEKRQLDQEMRDLQNKMREIEEAERRANADKARMQQDLARIQERALLKGEEIQQAREREELEKLEAQRREIEQKKREQEEQVRRAMDEIKRMQLDMERKMADLERMEKDLAAREAAKLNTQAQVTKNQEMRKAEIERQIDAIKMQAGFASGGTTGRSPISNSPSVPINISPNDSNALSLLVQQIAQLRNDISALQNYVVNNQSGGSFTAGSRGTTTTRPASRVTTSTGSNAEQSGSWSKVDYRKPGEKDAAIYAPFGSNEGVKKANEHTNMEVGKMTEPKFAGDSQAMKKEIAQKLQAAGACGLVQTSFIITVSPAGQVIGYDITFANTPQLKMQLGPILKDLKFQSTPTTRMPSRALYQLKAEIVCEGVERINIKDVPDLINP